MWCESCQQDVPGIASLEEGAFCCARCGGQVQGRHDQPRPVEACAVDDSGLSLRAMDPINLELPVKLDDWESEEEGQRFQRQLAMASDRVEPRSAQSTLAHRFDPPQIDLADLNRIEQSHNPAPPISHEIKKPRNSPFAWIAIGVGLMVFACGGVLLAWSVTTGRSELWNLGMPLALGGQFSLILGLVLQLERLWQTGSDTTTKLSEVDEQLHELKHTATLLGKHNASGSQAFYAHLADGASPRLLLSDLKGQFDLLSARMTNRR